MMRDQHLRPSVLVVAYDFPPHAAIGTMRTLRVVRQLQARGWRVTVLTGDAAGYLPNTPVDAALFEQVPPDVQVIRARPRRPWNHLQHFARRAFRPAGDRRTQAENASPAVDHVHRQRQHFRLFKAVSDVVDAALSIPDRESGWLVPALSKGVVERLRGVRPDLIYSSSPPWTGMLVAAGLQCVLRRPWVADFRDPWARAPWRGDRFRFALRAAALLERFVVRRADRVVFVATANRDDFSRHYGPELSAKFEVVPNGCDPTEFDALGPVAAPQGGPFVLLHAGSLYAGRTPVPVFKALARAIQAGELARDQIKLRFLGVNALAGVDLTGVSRALGLEDVVEFLPRVSREQSLRAMMTASGLLLLQPGHTVSVPAKVYEYLAAGRPIFAIAEEGETAEIVRRSGLGTSVPPDDEHAVMRALIAFVNRQSAPVRRPARELYDGTIGATRIAELLESMIEVTGAGADYASAEVKL